MFTILPFRAKRIGTASQNTKMMEYNRAFKNSTLLNSSGRSAIDFSHCSPINPRIPQTSFSIDQAITTIEVYLSLFL